ncbi:MAG: tRNA (guanosine(37)-N1)-methyltransferase TrmD [Spirochaetales bacterium]|nr:tRNA (guanosine(37)-N1)-methyltransferase TrmD [Spirochaetales bacterium]
MIFNILTLFPESFQGYMDTSILGKVIEKKIISVNLVNIRDFAYDKHRKCDDSPYGGGPGMVLKPEPLSGAIESLGKGPRRVIYLTPAGKLYNQQYAEALAKEKELVLICGKYEGIDQRIIDQYVTDEISIGDYVLSSGEIAAKVIIDSVSRLVSGVIKEESLLEESFNRGILEYPQYTRPQVFNGREVPEILITGHHANIQEWRLKKGIEKTLKNRPDLLDRVDLDENIKEYLNNITGGQSNGPNKSDRS